MSVSWLLLLVTIELVGYRWNPALAFGFLEEGSECSSGSSSGICSLVSKCPPALKALQEFRRHNFERCGFSGGEEIVCCIEDDDSKAEVRGPIISKSIQVCERYAHEFSQKTTQLHIDFFILDGTDAEIGEFPHMAAIGYEGDAPDEVEWGCGGSLISDTYVLTAAHCVVKRGRIPILVRLGKVDINGTSDGATAYDYKIKNITVHPDYSRTTKQNDIALILLTSSVKYNSNVKPACLYHKSDDPPNLFITGWGYTTATHNTTTILQKASIEPVPIDQCNATHLAIPGSKSLSRMQLCAKAKVGKQDTCQGDSGGPIQAQLMKDSKIYTIVGVTSFGRGCGGSVPGVYTRISSYLSWIEKLVWP